MTSSLRVSSPFEGHLDVDTLAGTASVSVHRHAMTPWGPACLLVASVMLDPPEVLQLATELTQGSVPPPPPVALVRRRVRVFRGDDLLWRYSCPECLPAALPSQEHGRALAQALGHLELVHADERRSA